VTRARRRRELALFLIRLALGRWRRNDQVTIDTATRVRVKLLSRSRRFKAAIDGELCALEGETDLAIHPAALKVLIPADSPYA
jgi:diacylglycerol kinase family enzyme